MTTHSTQPRRRRPSRRPNPRPRRGFTLIELLMAMTMTAIIAGSLYAALRIGFRAESAAEAAVEPIRTAELSMSLLRPDFESAVAPSGVLRGAFTGTDQNGGGGMPADALEFYTLGDPVEASAQTQSSGTNGSSTGGGMGGMFPSGGSGLGSVTPGTAYSASAAYAGFVPGAGDVRMVDLFVQAYPSGNVLVRRVTANLLSPSTPTYYDEVVCRGVRSFNLRYFDGSAWQESWDSTLQDNNAPTAVEVTLELLRGDAEQPRVVRFTRVFLVSTSGLWQTSAAASTTGGTAQ